MRTPHVAGSPVNNRRYKNWMDRFASYRSGVSRATIENWIDQFKDDDKDLAARVLDAVMFFGQDQIATNFKALMRSVPGWDDQKSKRAGRWFFVAMSSSSGESGDGMAYLFRTAMGMGSKSHNEMFVHRSELVKQELTSDDTVVLIDDFSGTGKQVCDSWSEAFSELVAGAGKVFLILVAVTETAKSRILQDTELVLFPGHVLAEKDNFFSSQCRHFTNLEKAAVLSYNKKANRREPKGFGDCGLLVVFNHKCPNNSLPILHSDHSEWTGLFPRNE